MTAAGFVARPLSPPSQAVEQVHDPPRLDMHAERCTEVAEQQQGQRLGTGAQHPPRSDRPHQRRDRCTTISGERSRSRRWSTTVVPLTRTATETRRPSSATPAFSRVVGLVVAIGLPSKGADSTLSAGRPRRTPEQARATGSACYGLVGIRPMGQARSSDDIPLTSPTEGDPVLLPHPPATAKPAVWRFSSGIARHPT